MSHPVVFRPPQARFLTTPQTPLCYWLRDRFFELLAGRTLGDVADVCQGLATADDTRFVRFVWEVPQAEWGRPVRGRRWVPFEKGGGYGKWFGHHFWVVDWEYNGSRIKGTGEAYARNEDRYFTEGWTYTWIARGSLGLRLMSEPAIIAGAASSGIYLRERYPAVAAVLNCRFASAMVRGLSAKIQLPESSVSRVPLLDGDLEGFAAFQASCLAIKRWIVAQASTERSFGRIAPRGSSLAEAYRVATEQVEAAVAILHTLEGISEREVFSGYRIDGDDVAAVLDETGTPAGWFRLIPGYDALPSLPAGLSLGGDLVVRLNSELRRALSADGFTGIKRRLRAIYEGGSGTTTDAEDAAPASGDDEEGDNGDAVVTGARIPIPPETFIEELAQKIEVHPVSVYWLLHEMRREEGLVCASELRRFAEDYFSVLVLRLVGHRWPREIESGEPAPVWPDPDGIVPITPGTDEPALLSLVRERVAEDFGPARVAVIEQEFREIVGVSLEAWLAAEFFTRHISQFKRRPIAWQLRSSPTGNEVRGRGKGRKPATRRSSPIFSCLVYYHRVDADLLPKLRTHYIGPLMRGFQTELGDLEKVKTRTAEQDARRLELVERIDELKAFDRQLEEVSVRGFACSALEKIAQAEALDQWASRDGRSPAPASRDVFLSQEARYDPDLNDGVRVNVAPLQRGGLLAADVLSPKDVEKAVKDRAEWRGDERRWCREGRLPRPGWWSEVAVDAKPAGASTRRSSRR